MMEDGLMDDLVTWLRAQADEDEQVARAAGGHAWIRRPATVEIAAPQSDDGLTVRIDAGSVFVAVHIARHDPARVLRDVQAKRRIIAQYETARDQARNPVSAKNYEMARLEQGVLGDVLRLLALPLADRPGYREEWRP